MKIIFLTFFVLEVGCVFAQAVPDNIRATNTVDVITREVLSDHMIYGIPHKPGKIEGNVYLSDEWKKTFLQVYKTDKIIGAYSCKVNLHTGQIEVLDNQVVKVVDSKKVKSFVMEDVDGKKYFVNGQDYFFEQAPFDGFLEVLVDGKIPLLKHTSLIIMRPDYKPELNVGNKNVRIIKKEIFVFANQKELTDAKTVKKNLEKIFGDKTLEVKKFIHNKSLKFSNKNDLILIVQFYNTLTQLN